MTNSNPKGNLISRLSGNQVEEHRKIKKKKKALSTWEQRRNQRAASGDWSQTDLMSVVHACFQGLKDVFWLSELHTPPPKKMDNLSYEVFQAVGTEGRESMFCLLFICSHV